MENIFIFTIKRNKIAQLLVVILIALSVWWITMFARGLQEGLENNTYTLVYPLIAFIGSVSGLMVSKKWGGMSSVIGRGLTLLSFGLFAQFFGQASYAYLLYVQGKPVEELYPSVGDVGYFGSVVLYFFSLIFIAKVVGVKLSMRSYKNHIFSILIPFLMLGLSYYLLLRDYVVDWSVPITTLLDLGYPLGQAMYVSLAILTYTFSRKFLGGLMRGPILFLLVALVVQYISDFTFLYQLRLEQWYVGGINDYMYTVSYALMAIGLIQIGRALDRIKEL